MCIIIGDVYQLSYPFRFLNLIPLFCINLIVLDCKYFGVYLLKRGLSVPFLQILQIRDKHSYQGFTISPSFKKEMEEMEMLVFSSSLASKPINIHWNRTGFVSARFRPLRANKTGFNLILFLVKVGDSDYDVKKN